MLKNRIKQHHHLLFHLLIIVIFSLIPFLWLKDGQTVLGHDAGFPLSPWEHFLDRVFVWTHRFGLGNDQTTEVGGFFIHGFEGIVDWLGFSLTNVQKITFSFYFLGFGLSMYFLAREMFDERKKHLPLLASLFYMMNHFLLQAWFIVERTKFTLYIALPIILMLILKMYKSKLSVLETAILAGLTIFFLNGGGFFPLFGAFLITVPYFLIMLILFSDQKIATLKKFVLFCLGWVFFTLSFNAYWVIPYVRFTLTSFSQELSTAGGTSGIVAWVKTISAHTSFYNMFRLQGIQEWYVNQLHPYAATMLDNGIFYLASYIWPFLAFTSFLFSEKKSEKKMVLLLLGLALLGMFFMAGSHPPFGFIYLWLIQNIPGFVIFRTPFYKFAPTLFLSFSLLMAFSIDYLISKFTHKYIQWVAVSVVIVGWSIFHFPYFTATFFDYEVNQKTTRVTVPDYVFEYAEWANSDEFPYQRLLLLPGQNPSTHFEAYTWGYWSLAQIQGLIDNRSYIGNSLYKSVSEEIFIRNLYELVEKKDPTWVDQAQYLFVDAILLRKDFDYSLKNSVTTSPNELETFLEQDQRFKKIKEFDQWIIYELESNPKSFAFKDYFYEVHVQDKEKFFEPTTIPAINLDQKTVFVEENIENFEERKKGEIYIPECIHCLLDDRNLYPIDRNQIITAGSIFYPYKIKGDEKLLRKAANSKDKLQTSAEIVTKRLYQLQSQFIRMAPIEERLVGWEEFVAALKDQKEFLNQYLSEIDQYRFEQNDFLSVVYENIGQQLEELQINMKDVNQEEEAALFIETITLLEELESTINQHLWYTENNTDKKYLLEVNVPGEYELYVKANTINIFSHPIENLNLTINDQLQQIPFNQIRYDSEQDTWTRLATLPLEKGTNKLMITDSQAITYLGDNGQLDFEYKNQKQCQDYDLGYLERDHYRFNFEAESLKEITDLFVFINRKGEQRPLLPYWGRKLEIDQQKITFLDFSQEIIEPGEYEIKFCRLSTGEITDREVEMTNAYFERLSSPLVTLVKLNPNQETITTDLSVDTDKINQTKYQLTINNSGKSLLMFDQRFDSGWQIDGDNSIFINHQRVHGYANGWLIDKTDPQPINFSLSYIGQKLYRYGWIVSLLSLSSALFLLAVTIIKKKVLKE